MDAITIDRRLSPLLLQLPSRQVWVDYDEEVDVLYLGSCTRNERIILAGATQGRCPYFISVRRGLCSGAEAVVFPTPTGRSRVDLPPHPYRVARASQGQPSQAPQAGAAPTTLLQRASILRRMPPQTAGRGV